jgi:hypothetical protein
MLDTGNATLLLASAESQGFIDTSEGDWAASARKVLMYCEARSTATAASLRNLSQPVGDAGKRSAIILNSMNFDQSQQVTLRAALRGPSADEFWLPDATEDLAGEARIVCYLATRGTYSLNALYELVETASSVLVSGGVNAFLSRLVRVSNRAEGASNLTPGAVFACLQSPQYEGVVGIPILKNDLLNIINTLASSLTGQRIPEEALEAMRLALGSPDFADEDE